MPIRKYRIDPSAIKPVTRRRVLRQLMWLLPFTAFLSLGMVLLVPGMGMGELGPLAFVPVGFAAGAVGISAAIGLKKARRSFSRLELTVSENVLRLQTGDMAPIEVLRPEVTRIVEVPRYGLMVHTSDPAKSVMVSEYFAGFAELRAHLASWHRFEPPQAIRQGMQSLLWSVLLLGSWIATGLVQNIFIASLAGLVLIGTGSMILKRVLEAKTLSNRYKASAVLSLGMLMLAPVARWVLHFLMKAPGGQPS